MTAIKCLVLLLLLLVVAAGVGIAGCRVLNTDAHLHDLLPAFSIVLVAAVLAVIPAVIQQGRLDTAGMFQAALIGTVLHLGLALIIALVLLVLKRVTTPFVLWLLAGYWATLIGLCVIFAKLIRTAPKAAKTGM